ncbi:16S rRNA (cytidine(1402)-2'-O)-methyltransferase [Candidatus Roizmanbacteria bacterium CG11_big_fil_rev_8_21_14_0_20_36_8]|uniref:16S rRNA (Cytidine(1402)-2'-O)-methyltransferase n=1 Tax=Candidatus Roizmanbacteria bacterium CG11_big_fil_rev_8_21_14_0_20_36_8 TaxID=1974856 RepID=A0A2M6ITZ0_9BACT|nr:MAG: 16S rRNA (cytidine(1402)-2'-O)-methyltransferase [Candidatus Roizmanbacteria bacterium CG11_big_fil_rev_8_21_14_0_20_36_8]
MNQENDYYQQESTPSGNLIPFNQAHMLYIIGTPIGNIQDISYRAASILQSCKYILCEDTRSADIMLSKLVELTGITPKTKSHKLISYYKDREMEKLPEIIDLLNAGNDMCLISEAGMPLISDPGYLLMKVAINEGIEYTVIPGPSSVLTALIHSGYKSDTFMFLGFLPKKKGQLLKLIDKIKKIKEVFPNNSFVAFESPHRIKETIEILRRELPENSVTIARELTKKYEEVFRINQKNELTAETEIKGEITLVID